MLFGPVTVTKHIILCQYLAFWCIISTWQHRSLAVFLVWRVWKWVDEDWGDENNTVDRVAPYCMGWFSHTAGSPGLQASAFCTLLKDIILYKNTQLLSDGNAPWDCDSLSAWGVRDDMEAKHLQPSDWWTQWWPVVTLKVICVGFCSENQFSACTPAYLWPLVVK